MEKTVEQVMELGTELLKVSERISLLEKDAIFITDFLADKQASFADRLTEFDRKLKEVDDTVKVVSVDIKNANIAFDKLIAQLKESAHQQSVERVSERVDAWNPERFVTRYELSRWLND
jgi:hypothetical protein